MTDATGIPASADVLRSLNRLRSNDPLERQSGIKVLSALLDDPRVRQVFEHLYQHDSDPDVRALAWQALAGTAPSIPGPEPDPQSRAADHQSMASPASSSKGTVPNLPVSGLDATRTEASPRLPLSSRRGTVSHTGSSRAVRRSVSRLPKTLFLLDSRHARRVARWQKNARSTDARGSSRWRWLASLLLIGIGLLCGVVLPDWLDWWTLRQSGVVVQGEVVGAEIRGDDGFFVYVQYPFAVEARSLAYTVEQRVVETDFNRLGLATPVAVRYVPDQPDLAQLEGVPAVHTWRDVLTVVAVALTVVLLIGMIWTRARRRSLSRSAQLIQGRVVKCRGIADDDGEYTVLLRYRFLTPGGRVIVDQIGQTRHDWRDRKLPVPGTPVVIEYHNESVYHLL